MNLIRNILIVTILVLISGCQGTPSKIPLSEVEAANQAQGEDGEQKVTVVCKEYKPTGSRIGKKVCRTEEAWDELERTAQNSLDKATLPQSNNPREGG